MATVYILYSDMLDKYYIGCTADALEQRLRKHLYDHKGFTARAKDWIIAYHELFENKSDALKREKEIKSWKSKNRIKELISSANRASR